MNGTPGRVTTGPGGRISVDRLGMAFRAGDGSRFEALQDLSLHIEPGEIVCLLGPSGCGKSTLLGALAGHIAPARGRLQLDGVPIQGPAPDRGLVFQQHTLFPWKTALENVAFGLKMKGVKRRERIHQAQEMLRLVGLAGCEGRYPPQLSGGMQQRVEIARALINSPRVLLMDEPFGALDAPTRARMQELLLDLWSRMHITVVFVTHDIDEALFLADRIAILSRSPGRIVDEVVVRSPRPRRAQQLTECPFLELKRHCLSLLHPNVPVASDRGSPQAIGAMQVEGV